MRSAVMAAAICGTACRWPIPPSDLRDTSARPGASLRKINQWTAVVRVHSDASELDSTLSRFQENQAGSPFKGFDDFLSASRAPGPPRERADSRR